MFVYKKLIKRHFLTDCKNRRRLLIRPVCMYFFVIFMHNFRKCDPIFIILFVCNFKAHVLSHLNFIKLRWLEPVCFYKNVKNSMPILNSCPIRKVFVFSVTVTQMRDLSKGRNVYWTTSRIH